MASSWNILNHEDVGRELGSGDQDESIPFNWIGLGSVRRNDNPFHKMEGVFC